ncbi:hypothetical protein PFMC_02649 [Plasmodium falciparum CAMP/Malaysia]|uniref:Rifin n=1 Tax=Plasmodium falciparum (isolate Camp / Malaysia) TaxID=5835 RepID=A0A024X8N8_PLAFC|nr:hypothetical protein PFMC_02649 [Plasmodium falciparum CAMP/Malaysia]
MKVHYINILLFELLLKILVNTHRNPCITTCHTQTNRSLCECELYAPSNYDNDPQMKFVMENFNRQTSQRFHEYDDRMISKRKHCKDKCDKEIQKIILEDKLEKELMDKFATLHTDVQNDAIPTCVCEKSLADNVEKGCLRCGCILGAAMPELGSIGGSLLSALSAWKPEAIAAAIVAAKEAGATKGAAKGLAAGMRVTIGVLEQRGVRLLCPELLESIGSKIHYTDAEEIAKIILENLNKYCGFDSTANGFPCLEIRTKLGIFLPGNRLAPPDDIYIPKMMKDIVYKAKLTTDDVTKTISERVTGILTRQQTSEIAATYASWQTAIIASIVAIVVIVLIMVIIYLILRYRRKKKMKKKLQYIKLLEE